MIIDAVFTEVLHALNAEFGTLATADYRINAHNTSATAHPDIRTAIDEKISEVAQAIGDISTAFDELHAYAQALAVGGAE